ncbi:hypothetical protein [Pseudomonas sp. EA_35y_Pfl2_R5]|uniref:hypothetical protein n=1 Tax=Pseudomonas sp. EA_35y_Pfl2_R5 TaxID=3088690 RepID=UPI0030DD750B
MQVSMDWNKETNFVGFLNLLSSELLSEAHFVLLVGSYSEGLATSTSDVDLYVCCANGYSGALHNLEEMSRQPDRRVEVSVVDLGYIERKLQKANSDNYDGFSLREVEILHKLLKGKVLAGLAKYCDITSSVSRRSFDDKAIKYFHDFSVNHYDDMVGAHLDRDVASAAVFARFLADSAVDTALAAAGDTYPKFKWRLKRAGRAVSAALYNEYLWVTFNATLTSDEDYAAHCQRSLLLYRELNFGVWYGKNISLVAGCQVSGEAAEYVVDPWVFPYIFRDMRLAKYRGKTYHIGLLAHLIVSFAFQPRSLRSMVSIGETKGYSKTEINAAMANLISLGLLTRISV